MPKDPSEVDSTDLRSRIEHDRFARLPPRHLQTAGFSLMATLVLAGLLGLFGGGPLNKARVEDEQGRLTVEYPRFARSVSESELHVRVRVDPGETWLKLSFSQDYLDRAGVQQVIPLPARSELGDGWVTFWFPLVPSKSHATVIIQLKPGRAAYLAGAAALDRRSAVRFRQFVYP